MIANWARGSSGAPLVAPEPAGVLGSGVIDSTSEIPEGYLLSRPGGEIAIPEEWRTSFAVLRSGKVHYLVAASASYGSGQMFELRRRMMKDGMTDIRTINASGEVIKLMYAEQSSVANEDGERTNVEELAGTIISAAVEHGASDIHIESRVARANVYFRVNGLRVFYCDLAADTAHSLGVVLYSVHADAASKEISWNPEQVMDGALEWTTTSGATYQLRFSSAPIHPAGGFHIVIRLLSMEIKGISLETLGYSREHRMMLDIMTSGSSGIVIMCGPTNSGKSTSLQALMAGIYKKRGDTIKMITVEDPVEYVIPGACQISVGRKRKTSIDAHTGSAFTTFLRGTLRQDPDVVMVGEIRDHDSATVVKDLVLAGRKILATLHTYSALWAYVRLREIGIPWEILTMPGFIAGIVYQRLVPTLCPHCSIALVDGAERVSKETLYRIQQVSDLATDKVRVKGDGCEHCRHTGIAGRTVCAEFVLPDRMLLKFLAASDFLGAEKYWRDAGVGAIGGGVSSLAHGIQKMRQGLVSPLDVEEQIGLLTSDMVNADSMISSTEISVLSGSGREMQS